MARSDTQGRTWTKKVAGKPDLTRTVYTPSDAVQAKFDGFVEDKPAAARAPRGGVGTASSTADSASS